MKPTALLTAALLVAGCSSPRFSTRPTLPAPARSGPHALGLVRVKPPWYATRGAITSRFVDAVPEYEAIAGIERKYFTIGDDGRYGGVYLWSSREAAAGYYSEAWRAGIRLRRGAEPELLLLDAPFVVEGSTVIEGEPVGQRASSYPATATLALWSSGSSARLPTPDVGGAEAGELARRLGTDPALRSGLIVAIVVAQGTERLGFVGLWATRALAEQGVSASRIAALGGADANVSLFDAPVLLDAALRAP